MGSDKLHDNTVEQSGSFEKASLMQEMGRIMENAYEKGVSLEEAYAICGAAYGDWREAHEGRIQAMFKEKTSGDRR